VSPISSNAKYPRHVNKGLLLLLLLLLAIQTMKMIGRKTSVQEHPDFFGSFFFVHETTAEVKGSLSQLMDE